MGGEERAIAGPTGSSLGYSTSRYAFLTSNPNAPRVTGHQAPIQNITNGLTHKTPRQLLQLLIVVNVS